MNKRLMVQVIKYLIILSTFFPLVIWSAWNDGVGGENGFFVPNGGNQDIRQWETCRNIQPSGCPAPAVGVFIPTRTQLQWRQFTSNVPSCVTATVISCQ